MPSDHPPLTVLLAAPRGFCAGVERAVEVVEVALERFGPPIYVRHAIVHNTRVVADLERKGAIFVEDEGEVPEGGRLVFSAHGIPPQVRTEADRLGLRTIDATCPLVTKVHYEALDYAAEGLDIILVGHAGHQEVVGTTGHAPESIHLVESPEDVWALELPDSARVAYLTQTTLSVDEASAVIAAIHDKYPHVRGPRGVDICYATTNRQEATKVLAARSDVVLVIGSETSSNSKRMVEVARAHGAPSAHLVDHVGALDEQWLAGVSTVGLTSGASAPEALVEEVIAHLEARPEGASVRTLDVIDEDMHFALPKELRPLPTVEV